MTRYATYGFEGKRWVAYFYCIGWDHWSLGFHACLTAPNIEIHLPFGFFRLGRHTNSRPNPRRRWSWSNTRWWAV